MIKSFSELKDEYDRDDRCSFDTCAKCGNETGSLSYDGMRICHACGIWGLENPHTPIVDWTARGLVNQLSPVVGGKDQAKELVREDREKAEKIANKQIGFSSSI